MCLTRRAFALSLAAALLPRKLTLGFSTYGMPKLTTEKAITEVAAIGFDSVEIAVMPDRDAAPPSRRKAIRKLLADHNLKLTALMENLTPSAKDAVDRLKAAADTAHDLSPDAPPLIETVLGGGKWDEVKSAFRDRLGDWVRVVTERKVTLAIKPHRFGAMTLPEHAVWLMKQLRDPPRLRMVFDYSHYDLRGLDMEGLVKSAEGKVAFVAVKDVAMKDGKAVFLLPGETGKCDYPKLFTLLSRAGYEGDVNCEVSGMVSARKDYDAVAAAKACYKRMSAALADSGLR